MLRKFLRKMLREASQFFNDEREAGKVIFKTSATSFRMCEMLKMKSVIGKYWKKLNILRKEKYHGNLRSTTKNT